ncbi:hypothetical protein ABT095_22245, partial [Kitasatospora sp. NPDC002227]
DTVPAQHVSAGMPLGGDTVPAQHVSAGMPLGGDTVPAQHVSAGMPLGGDTVPARHVGDGVPFDSDVTPAHTVGGAGSPGGLLGDGVEPARMVPKESGVPLSSVPATAGVPMHDAFGGPVEPAQMVPKDGLSAAVPKESGVPLSSVPATAGVPMHDASGNPVEPAQMVRKDGLTPAESTEAGVPSRDLNRTQPDSVARSAAAQNQPAGGSGGGGGAGQGFEVNADQYRAAINPILAAMEQLSELGTSLTSFLTSMESNAPWGKDESGKKFSEGEKGYLHYSAESQKGVKSLAQALEGVAANLKTMADGYDSSEQFSTGGFAGGEGGSGGGQIGATPPPTYTPPVHIPVSPSITLPHTSTSGRH